MLRDKLEALIKELEIDTENILRNRRQDFKDNYQRLLTMMFDILPDIISSYSDERMTDLKDDATYWPAQVEKIVSLVTDGSDALAMADALYFELCGNLIEYQKVLVSRQIDN